MLDLDFDEEGEARVKFASTDCAKNALAPIDGGVYIDTSEGWMERVLDGLPEDVAGNIREMSDWFDGGGWSNASD